MFLILSGFMWLSGVCILVFSFPMSLAFGVFLGLFSLFSSCISSVFVAFVGFVSFFILEWASWVFLCVGWLVFLVGLC